MLSEERISGMSSIIKTILTTSGPVALLALGLAIFQGYYIWEKLGTIESNQESIMGVMSGADKQMSIFVAMHTELEKQRLDLLKTQIRILQRICKNTTESPAGLIACYGEEAPRVD